MRTHRYAVGQHVSYAEDYSPTRIWVHGYEIVSLLPAGNREPQYQIRTDDQTYDRVVWESQLQEEFGRRMRLNKQALRTTLVLASPDRRARQHRNDPKRLSQRQDLTRWDDEGGAPRSGHHSSAPPPSQPKAETALYYFNIQTGRRLIEDPEGNRYPDLQAARDVAVAMVRDLMVEGDQQGEDRQGWQVEIMDRANHPVMTLAFSDVRSPGTSG
jgi:ribosomal protein S6